MSYDFGIKKNKQIICLVECQGRHHYRVSSLFGGEEQFAKQQLHDELKKEYAKKIGMPLIEILYKCKTYEDVVGFFDKKLKKFGLV